MPLLVLSQKSCNSIKIKRDEINQMKKTKVSIGLSNPKSPGNVGSVMRAAGNFRVDSVFYTGIRYPLALERNSVTENLRRKVSHDIPLSGVSSLLEAAPDNTEIICVEYALNATPLPEFQHPDNAFYIFGPEDGTLDQAMIDQADAVVYVPTTGCMNLAATVNVVLYDRLTKSYAGTGSNSIENNQRIRQNRDTNNNVKVR